MGRTINTNPKCEISNRLLELLAKETPNTPDFLRAVMFIKGVSQPELSDALGVSRSMVSTYLSNPKLLTSSFLYKITKALKIKPEPVFKNWALWKLEISKKDERIDKLAKQVIKKLKI